MRVTHHFDIYPTIVDYSEVKRRAIASKGKPFKYDYHTLKAIKDGKTLRVIKVSDIRGGIS
jgi:hypothetical protein